MTQRLRVVLGFGFGFFLDLDSWIWVRVRARGSGSGFWRMEAKRGKKPRIHTQEIWVLIAARNGTFGW